MTQRCLHCQSPLAAQAPSERFCCQGCALAFDWINEAGLGAYYQLCGANESLDVPTPPSTFDQRLQHFDRPEVLAKYAQNVQAGLRISLALRGIRCAACVWLIEQSLMRQAGVIACQANALTGALMLHFDPAQNRLSSLLGVVAKLGYQAYLAEDAAENQANERERRQWLTRLGVALIAAVQAMMFSEALYLDVAGSMATETRDALRWLSFLMTTPVVFYSGFGFLRGAYVELRARALGMDFLVASSVLLAYFASVLETIRGGSQVYFDAAAMFVLLLLIARGLEARARAHARSAAHVLTRALPEVAERASESGALEVVASAELLPGDRVFVRAGEAVPVDAFLLDTDQSAPRSYRLNEAAISGESDVVLRRAGEPLCAGSIALEPLWIRCRSASSGSWLRQLAALAAQQRQRLPVEQRLLAWSQWFALGMLLAAVATYALWQLVEPERAFEIALAVLASSCPCAFALAAPAALHAGHSALLRLGVLSTGAIDLRMLGKLGCVVFDKTGTLTQNSLEIRATAWASGCDQALLASLILALECGSTHPVAQAFRRYFLEIAPTGISLLPDSWRELPGQGVQGHWFDPQAKRVRTVRLGSAAFATGQSDDGAVVLSLDGAWQARFEWRERLRHDALKARAALRALAIPCVMLSGDSPGKVQALQSQLAMDAVYAGADPTQKLRILGELKARYGSVLMVGDGLNDAPVLAAADLSMALSHASAMSLKNADFVLMRDQLSTIAPAITLARHTTRVLAQNLGWAAAYNLCVLPVAMAGYLLPWQAALGMTLSSLMVTANALRVRAPVLSTKSSGTMDYREVAEIRP